MATLFPAADSSPRTWLKQLGWGHAGYRVTSAMGARLALVLLLLVPFLIDVGAALRSTTAPIYSDLATYYDALRCLRELPYQSVYSQTPAFLYPPVFLTLLDLLFRLPLPLGVAAFQVLKWSALYASLRLAWRLCSPPAEDAPPIVALGSLLLTARFIANDMGNANINVFVLLSLLAAARLVGRGQAALGGLILAPAIAVKLSPALLLVYFLYKGWWRAVPAALLGIVLCWLVLPALHLDWGRNLSEFAAWYNHVVASYVSTGEIWSIHLNQSLPALVNRLLGSHVSIEPDVRVALVTLPGPVLRGLRLILALFVLVGAAYLCRRRFSPRESPLAFAAEIGVVQVAMLALSGYAWKAHFVALLLPYAALLAYLADTRYPHGRRHVAAALITSIALGVLSTDVITRTGRCYAEAFGAVLWCGLAAAGGLWALRNAIGSQPATLRAGNARTS